MLHPNMNQLNIDNENHRKNIQNRVIDIINSYYEKDIQKENETIDMEME